VRRFEQDELAEWVLHEVTTCLVEVLGLKIDQQRLDSTHVFSDMAPWGRTRLLGVALKRFLTQVKRHDPAAYAALDSALRERYAPSDLRLFADQPAPANRSSYRAMERIFYEQGEVHEEKVLVKAKTGNTVRQNPSDPDATYDGYKGPGYQVQIAETCSADNAVQLIPCALPQTAAVPDEAAVAPVLADLQASQLLPEELQGDTHYPSEENVQLAERYGVELVGPVPGAAPAERPDDLNIDDFVIDEATEQVVCGPDGQTPVTSVHDPVKGKTRTTMSAAVCGRCAYRHQCPVEEGPDGYPLEHTAQQRRVAGRRREQQTEVFRERYRRRNGIESTNSGLKRRTGLGRLRVRGRRRVFQAIYLKIAGWNLLRASVCAAMRKWVQAKAQTAVFRLSAAVGTASRACGNVVQSLPTRILAFHGPFPDDLGFTRAA
jgi:hypothetical protein